MTSKSSPGSLKVGTVDQTTTIIDRKKEGQSNAGKPKDYSSHGVMDNDLFMLPSSDFQLLGLLTIVAAIVRLFRIYQPSSVVFDEVQ